MKTLKHISIPLVILAALCIGLVACNTTQQRTTYNTLSSVEATATATVDGYFLASAKGLADTNGIPRVSRAFNEFQLVMNVAVLAAQNNSNVLASSNVMQELSAVLAVVAEFSPPPSKTKVVPIP